MFNNQLTLNGKQLSYNIGIRLMFVMVEAYLEWIVLGGVVHMKFESTLKVIKNFIRGAMKYKKYVQDTIQIPYDLYYTIFRHKIKHKNGFKKTYNGSMSLVEYVKYTDFIVTI